MEAQTFTLKDLAVAALSYLGLPHATADIGSGGASETVYAEAWTWANMAAQELADVGPWPWLAKCFVEVTVPADSWRVDLPGDVYRLLSDPSYEDALYLFGPATLQQVQQLRAGLTGSTGSPPTVLALGYATDADAWEADTDYVAGDYVQPTTGECPFRYECTTAGTSDATTEPTWPTALDDTVDDPVAGGEITWTCRFAGRTQLILWPENATETTVKICYARQLPAMTAATDVPLMPAHLHRIVLTGTLAYAEALNQRKWDGGARKTFNEQKAEAWENAHPSSQHLVAMRSHRHTGGPGGYRVPFPTVTHE